MAKGRGRTAPTAGEATPTEEQQGQYTMASGDEHSPPAPDDIQVMNDEERMALVERLLGSLSTARLESIGAKVQQVRQERIETEREVFIAWMAPFIAEAKPLGIELIIRRLVPGKNGAGKPKPKSETPAPFKGRRYPPGTYRNPENGEIWVSGGRPPKGIREAVAAGHDPSEFLVKPQEQGGEEKQTENEQPQEDPEVS